MPAASETHVWTTRQLLKWMGDAFARRGLDQPRLLAEMLLAMVLGCDRLRLYLDPERPASAAERARLRELVARALADEPVQYLTGEAWFFGLPFAVDRRVLIPRPSTVTLIERVLAHARAQPGIEDDLLIADICTGSGCIAATLAKHLPAARVLASDISREALSVASQNIQRHGVADRIELLEGDLLDPIAGHPAVAEGSTTSGVRYLVANPPYIPDDEWGAVEPNVKNHEPTVALRGGPDGMAYVGRILREGPKWIRSGGLLVVELAAARASHGLQLVQEHPRVAAAEMARDQDGLDRILVASIR
ncbi:MAG: peptide chain release factor N(5)-glutamine methyltransferase [Phycisphaeraceae bacterium]|nr:peptide chain release factor N(5)-glutamine methyltransferase [Phycisphaeraceae bacterium]